MTTELLLALGIPLAYMLVSTAILLKGDLELPRFVQRLNSRDALLWNTMVGITIAVGALRWALSREVLQRSTSRTCGGRPCCSNAWRRPRPFWWCKTRGPIALI